MHKRLKARIIFFTKNLQLNTMNSQKNSNVSSQTGVDILPHLVWWDEITLFVDVLEVDILAPLCLCDVNNVIVISKPCHA